MVSLAVSVVVPTFNRAEQLDRLLASLAVQTLAGDRFEVVVVDDGSTDRTSAVLEAWHSRIVGLTWSTQPNLGASRARNAGIARASAPIVAFTDSDCEPTPRWLEAMVARFDPDPSIAGVEGRTITLAERVTPFTHQVVNETGGYFATS